MYEAKSRDWPSSTLAHFHLPARLRMSVQNLGFSVPNWLPMVCKESEDSTGPPTLVCGTEYVVLGGVHEGAFGTGVNTWTVTMTPV